MPEFYEAELKLCLGEYSKHLYESLQAEARQQAPKKAQVEVSLEDSCVIITVKAATLSGLKAVINSHLYIVHAMYSTLKT
ncbi:MAG: KEOPS complex subunit Pcc1 [Thermoprotei archaeon]|nr:KEOPS complex subunit Pcc1 [Thermoprotei archaeon]